MKDPTGLERTALQRFMDALGFRLGSMGERLDMPLLTYNPLLFKHFDRFAMQSASGVVSVMQEMYPEARTFLDVGSGSGAFAAECKNSGLDVLAVENSKYGRVMAKRKGVECREFDLFKSPPSVIQGRFDVSYCFEVAEHIPSSMSGSLVNFIASHAVDVFFTAAQPGQRGFGHINCQPKEYWIRKFDEEEFVFDAARTAIASDLLNKSGCAYWFAKNLLMFRKAYEA